MTYTEAFTQAKDKENPGCNEDLIIADQGRLYAVIDGATDKSGRTYDDLTGGQIAGRILEDVLKNADRGSGQFETVPTSIILDRVNRRLRNRYRALGIADVIRREPWRRFSAQASIVIERNGVYRFIVIGDTGLRLNRKEVFFNPKPGDIICARLRVAVHRYLTKSGASDSTADRWSRAYTVEGLRAVLSAGPEVIGTTELGDLRNEALEESRRRLPNLAEKEIDDVLMYGLKGLHRYRNRPGPFGFPVIDGSPVPEDMIVEFERPAESIDCIELFSDGYVSIPHRAAVADWEALYANMERDDPKRLNAYPETKGSSAERFADDRTVLIVRPGMTTERRDETA